jgi:SAM-dependent methyltransferase
MRKKNPFAIEKERQKLATKGDLFHLKKLYHVSFPEIPNLNTGAFWNERIDENIDYKPTAGMESERIKIAYDFMPRKSEKILDVGAGYGFIEKLISKNRDIKIYGNDISRNAIKNLKKRFKGNFKL